MQHKPLQTLSNPFVFSMCVQIHKIINVKKKIKLRAVKLQASVSMLHSLYISLTNLHNQEFY